MINTLRYTKKLERAGVLRKQAEAHAQVMAEIVEQELSTKSDIEKLRQEIRDSEYRVVTKLGTIVTVALTLGLSILFGLLKFS